MRSLGKSTNIGAMKKAEAIQLLGGTTSAAAKAIGISTAAVSLWPDELPARIADRVQAALWRKGIASAMSAPKRNRKGS